MRRSAWRTSTTAIRSLIRGLRRRRRPREQADAADRRGGSGGAGAVVLDASESQSRGGGGGTADHPPARLPTEPAQAPDPWDMPASSQAGTADDQSAHDRGSS